MVTCPVKQMCPLFHRPGPVLKSNALNQAKHLVCLREGRHFGARRFVAADLNVELGLLCTGDEEDSELGELYGPLCWRGFEADPGRLQEN